MLRNEGASDSVETSRELPMRLTLSHARPVPRRSCILSYVSPFGRCPTWPLAVADNRCREAGRPENIDSVHAHL